MGKTRVVWTGLGLLAAALGAAWAFHLGPFSGNGNALPPRPAERVVAAVARRMDVPVTVELVGSVYPNQTVAVKSRLDSQIVAVRFRDGAAVHKGDVLFVLDDRTLRSQREQLAANLRREEAQLLNAQAQYERSARLAGRGYATNEKLDQDKAASDAQSAAVAASRSALEALDVQLDYAVIRAPISGRAGTIAVTAGNTVKANDATPLVTINQVDPALVQCAVPQRYYDAVRRAMTEGEVPIRAMRPESGVVATGRLDHIDNEINTANGTFMLRGRFDNPDEKLWPGMFVQAVLELGIEKRALVIPQPALQGPEGASFVFVATPEGKAARRALAGTRSLGNRIIVREGLEEGEKVITDGLLRVTDGASVDVVRTEDPAPPAPAETPVPEPVPAPVSAP